MTETNLNGYKMLYHIENVLRKYIEDYIEDYKIFGKETITKWEINLKDMGIEKIEGFHIILKYLHLGEIINLISSKKFNEIKKNSLKSINPKMIISNRNNVMHSREISFEEYNNITEVCNKVILSLEDNIIVTKWNQFLQSDINNFVIPELYLEYPVGKNFNRLVGRGDELNNFKSYIKAPIPVNVVGHGGVGKTALVLQLIEDLMSSPDKEFEYIYFMSFKNSVFDKGAVRRFEKVISSHSDLINKLSVLMNINTSKLNFEEIQEKVWKEIFSKKTLLVLDNLETEIVKSNLFEFSNIAQKFIMNFDKPSRLVMTSRYGLGDKENKFSLHQFNIQKTRELMNKYMNGIALKNRKPREEDWDWIQIYTQGNPGLIIALCHTLSSTRKSILELRLEYNSEYTKESTELHQQLDEFLGFCFENTIESMTKGSQIFLSCLCYICSESHINEINEELLSFLREELKLQKFSDNDTKASNFVNIGFLQPVPNSDRYLVNELVIDYMNGNYSNNDQVFNVFKLKEIRWFEDIYRIKTLINEFQFNEKISLEQLISQLYLSKYRTTKNIEFLLRSFSCNPTLDALSNFYKKADEVKILNHFNLLDRLNSELKDNKETNKQLIIVTIIISSLLKINQKILAREITNLKQYELFDYFNQLKHKIPALSQKKLDISLRKQICKLLINLKKLDLAETYLIEDFRMIEDRFDIYSKQVMELVHKDKERCNDYINKCNKISTEQSDKISRNQKAQYLIYASRFFIKEKPENVVRLLENYEEYSEEKIPAYIFYLESLLLRAKAISITKGEIEQAELLLERFKKFTKKEQYSKLFPDKKERLNRDFEITEKLVKNAMKRIQEC